jgi:hypothetical protein
MAKSDLSKELQELYFPSDKHFVTVKVPKMNFLKVDGMGDPNTSKDYIEAIGGLYTVAYTMKFMFTKGSKERSHVVMPLEGLWYASAQDFLKGNKGNWKWTAMLMQPEFVTSEIFEKARNEAKRKKNPPGLEKLRFEEFDEGLSAQILYLGPYADEGPTIQRLHEYIHAEGHDARGGHHEIYLSDPNRTAPQKLKTVIRQPMK